MANKEYDPNKHWYYEYSIGSLYGQGQGLYGQIGNDEYRQKKQQERQARQWNLPDVPPSGERSWSKAFALLGFLPA